MFILTFTQKFTVRLKGEALIKDKKSMEHLGKNPANHKSEHTETFTFEQKPIEIDDFNETEEKEVKERPEKRKIKRQEVAEKNKLLKKRKRRKKMNRTKK